MSKQSSRFQLTVLSLGLLVLGSLLAAACQQGASPTAPAAVEQSAWQSKKGPENEGKALVCHLGTNGPETLEVSQNAVPAHLGHGDTLGECSPPPSGTCPCYTDTDLAALAFSSGALCVNDPMGGAVGGEVSIDGANGLVQNLSTATLGLTCLILDYNTGVGSQQFDLSLEDWNACNDLVVAAGQSASVSCF